MKRVVIVLSVVSMVFGFLAFDCSSSEMNAAKMYMAENVKNYAKAKDQLNAEIAKNPKSEEAYYLLGQIDGIEGKYKSMVINYAKSVEISSKFKKDIDNQKAYYWQQAFNKGIAFYNRAMKVKSDSASSVFTRALTAFDEAMTILPDTLVAFENYAYAAINSGKVELAEAPLVKLTSKGKKPEHFTLLGQMYLERAGKAKQANNTAEANKYFDQTINLLNGVKGKFGSDAAFMQTLANAYVMSGRIEEAKTSFADGVKTQPNNKGFRYNYGTILLNIKDFTAAEEQLKKAVELDPTYLDAIYNLAACYINWAADMQEKATQNNTQSDYKEKVKLALPLLNKYLEKKPDDATVWDSLARAHTLLGNQKEAEEAFKKVDQYKK